MTIIELYINNRLCDIGRDFGIRLNRQLLNPGELNTKDAQYSYSITLPPTSNNHAIFNYANIEETANKFNREYKAELSINSVRVFVGLFRLSEVTRDKYKGNLYIPATKSIKDIFGELKLNENPEYRIEFKDFAEYVSYYNILAATGPQMAIFPYTLYGVLPKYPVDNDTPRLIWDDSVRMSIQDLAPSINPLLLLKHVFEGRKRNANGSYEGVKKYNLVGTAFNDERLTRLYMSYKNAPDYAQPWNYGKHAKIHVSGSWSNRYNKNVSGNVEQLERGVYESFGSEEELYACDLFDCNNAKVNKIEDQGGNVIISDRVDANGRKWYLTQIRIPASGYYKVQLKVSTQLENAYFTAKDDVTGIYFIGADGATGGLTHMKTAVKLLRDWGNGDFNVSGSRMDGRYYRDNLPQDNNSLPRYAPYYTPLAATINFVDKAQNPNYLSGFQWGKKVDNDVHPLDTNGNLSQINVGKPAHSWDSSVSNTDLSKIAIKVPSGYRKYAIPDDGSSENPVWGYTNRFACSLEASPLNYARRGYFNGVQANENYNADGSLNCIAWLNAGELLTLADVSDKGLQILIGIDRGWVSKTVTFDLEITPFRQDEDWLTIDQTGTSYAAMNWNDPVNFDVDSINLVGFLPADMKTDDFIDNFCKAFNLQLTQIDATTFELNVKQSKTAVSNLFINLDNLASVNDRSNTPLGLPSLYKLGFTVDVEEEGYVTTGDDGGGEYETGVTEEKIVEQKSNFSFNWFKNITYTVGGGSIVLPLAVISKREVWTGELSYPDAMKKRYPNQALRFWYPDGLLNDLGATFNFNGKPLSIVKVSNELTGLSILSYKNQKLTILTNYFTLLINGSSHYTEVEGYLTPDQYEDLNGAIMAMFNGDLYYVAEISGYDPTGRNKTKVKLIRKI